MVFLTLALRGFTRGTTPLIQSTKYLESDPLHFRNSVQVMLAHFNEKQAASEGLKQFCVWSIPQIQYQNPNVQINILKEMTPSPWLQFFLHDPHTEVEETVLVDCYAKTREQISDHLRRILGKTKRMLRREASMEATNPANFGYDCNRWCMCEVDGQVPCPGREMMPLMKRWKYIKNPDLCKEEMDEFLEFVDIYEEKRKAKHLPGMCFTQVMGLKPSAVYHEENKERWLFWKDKLDERERQKRGEEE